MNNLPRSDDALDALIEGCEAMYADGSTPLIVGIHTGGMWVARAVATAVGFNDELGELDIGFYRDDLRQRGFLPSSGSTRLPHLTDRRILLVDDVLHSGRTARAAINALFEFGRPAEIRLAVLIDRPGRQLPIQADVVGALVAHSPERRVKLHGPEPLSLEWAQ